MSTKSTQARASKRNARAKSKQASANKARQAPQTLRQKKFRSHIAGQYNFDNVLDSAVRDINKRKNVDSEIKSPEEMIEGVKKITGEVFKLYSYLTLINALIEKKVIAHTLNIDLESIGIDFLNMDNRISLLSTLLTAQQEEAVFTECLEISTDLQNYADEMHAEIVRSEPFSLDIEETIDRLAKEFPELSENEARARVLQGLAYTYLGKVKVARDAYEEQKAELQAAAENTPEPEVAK